MVTEAMDDMDDGIEEEADEEVERVVQSIVNGTFDNVSNKPVSIFFCFSGSLFFSLHKLPQTEETTDEELERRLAAVKT